MRTLSLTLKNIWNAVPEGERCDGPPGSVGTFPSKGSPPKVMGPQWPPGGHVIPHHIWITEHRPTVKRRDAGGEIEVSNFIPLQMHQIITKTTKKNKDNLNPLQIHQIITKATKKFFIPNNNKNNKEVLYNWVHLMTLESTIFIASKLWREFSCSS